MTIKGVLRTALLTLVVMLAQGTLALASNTGSISGKVTDQNGDPVAAAKVTVASPSQSASVTIAVSGLWIYARCAHAAQMHRANTNIALQAA